MNKYLKWIIFIICIVLFLILGIYIINIDNNIIDSSIYKLVISIKNNTITNIFKVLTFFASVKFIIVLTIILFIFTFIFKKYKYINIILIVNVINDAVLNTILKYIFKRPRPTGIMLVEESGYSFPSGHTMIACVFYGLLIYLVYKSKLSRYKKILINIVLLLFILSIGISRIYLGVHYPTDVIGSIFISIAYLVIYIDNIKKYINNIKNY